jgi:cell division inhibitor SepF
MSGLVNRLKNWVTGDEFDEEDIYSIDEEFDTPSRHNYSPPNKEDAMMMERNQPRRAKNLKILEHPAPTAAQEVIVLEPKAFDESLDMVEHLRLRKSVILNLHLLDTAQSQRVVDFLSGATHALDGHQQRIGDGVFIFTPSNVSIATEQAKSAMTFTTEALWSSHAR